MRRLFLVFFSPSKQKDPRIAPGVMNTEFSVEPAVKRARQITYGVRTGFRARWTSSTSGCSDATGSRPSVRSEEPGPEPGQPQEPGLGEPSEPFRSQSHRNQLCHSNLCRHSSHRPLHNHTHADPLRLDGERLGRNRPRQPSTRSQLRTSSSKDSCGPDRQVRRPLLCELVRRSRSDRR